MSNYSLEEVIRRWSLGKLTTEQAIGQMLLLMRELSERVGKLEQAVEARRGGKGTERRRARPKQNEGTNDQ